MRNCSRPAGKKVGGEFLVNTFTAFNQRTPAVAALSGGGFVVVWVSEQERVTDAAGSPSVDIYGRLYNASGAAAGGEFLVNTGTNICANPSVAASADGGFMVAWGQLDPVNRTNSWDVFARPFSSTGAGGTARRVNTFTFGDQYAPRISAERHRLPGRLDQPGPGRLPGRGVWTVPARRRFGLGR